MGNFAVDVMWRLGIGIDSRKGTRVDDLRLFLGSPSKIVQCIFVLLALDRLLHIFNYFGLSTHNTHYFRHYYRRTFPLDYYATPFYSFYTISVRKGKPATARDLFFLSASKEFRASN